MMKVIVELIVEKEYGNLDYHALAEVKDFLNEELPNYIEVYDENEDDVRLEVVDVRDVIVSEEEESN